MERKKGSAVGMAASRLFRVRVRVGVRGRVRVRVRVLGFGLGLGALLEDGAMGDRQLEQLEHRHHLVRGRGRGRGRGSG